MSRARYDPASPFVGRLRCGRCGWLGHPETGQRATVLLRRHGRACPEGAHPIGREYVFHEGADLDPGVWAALVEAEIDAPFAWLARQSPALDGRSPEDHLDAGGDPADVIKLLRVQ